MPRVESGLPLTEWVGSIGGSFATERIDGGIYRLKDRAVRRLADFCWELIEMELNPVLVVGGGIQARDVISNLRDQGEQDPVKLDEAGIEVTHQNAQRLAELFCQLNLPIQYISAEQILNDCPSGVVGPDDVLDRMVTVLGGTKAWQTTDTVMIETALNLGELIGFNISRVEGVYGRDKDVLLIDEGPIENMSWGEFLRQFPHEHEPGMHVPLDRRAAQLAQEARMSVVMVGGEDEEVIFNQLRLCLQGGYFVGTLICPEPVHDIVG